MNQQAQNGQEINVGQIERSASMVAGGLLAAIALRRSVGNLLLLALGGYLFYRGRTGRCKVYELLHLNTEHATGRLRGASRLMPLAGSAEGLHIAKSVTVNVTTETAYRFWRDLENLPSVMQHIESVTPAGYDRTHWVARAPVQMEWDAEITEDRPGEVIAWQSLPGSQVDTTGSVHFKEAPGNRGTEVQLSMNYSPPGGKPSVALGRLIKIVTAQQVKEDMRRFKAMLEAGEVISTTGQSSGRDEEEGGSEQRSTYYPKRSGRGKDAVQEASEQSFPASDPPGWTMRAENEG